MFDMAGHWRISVGYVHAAGATGRPPIQRWCGSLGSRVFKRVCLFFSGETRCGLSFGVCFRGGASWGVVFSLKVVFVRLWADSGEIESSCVEGGESHDFRGNGNVSDYLSVARRTAALFDVVGGSTCCTRPGEG